MRGHGSARGIPLRRTTDGGGVAVRAEPVFLPSRGEEKSVAKATWMGKVIAQSDRCAEVEGNQYFPAESVRQEYLRASDTHTECPWKGTASYYHLEVDGMRNADAAWYYPEPKPAAQHIRGYIAFWKGVHVEA